MSSKCREESETQDSFASFGIQKLPTEIWLQIFKTFENRNLRALAALVQTCKFFRDLATPILYREFVLPHGDELRVFDPLHYVALVSSTNPGPKFIRNLRFVADVCGMVDDDGMPLEIVQEQRKTGQRNIFDRIEPGQLRMIWFERNYRPIPMSYAAFFHFLQSQDRLEYLDIGVRNLLKGGQSETIPVLRHLKHISVSFEITGRQTWQLEAFTKSWILPSAKTLEHLRLQDDQFYEPEEGEPKKQLWWPQVLLSNDVGGDEEVEYPRFPNLRIFELGSRINPGIYLPILHKLFDCTRLRSFTFEQKYEDDLSYYQLLAEVVSKFVNLESLHLAKTGYSLADMVVEAARPLRRIVFDGDWPYYDCLPGYECLLRHKDTLQHLHILNHWPITIQSLNEEYKIWSYTRLETFIILSEQKALPRPKVYPPRKKWQEPSASTEALKLPRSLRALSLLQRSLDEFEDLPGHTHLGDYQYPPESHSIGEGTIEWVTWWRKEFLSTVPDFEFPTIDTVPMNSQDFDGESEPKGATRLVHRPQLQALQLGDNRQHRSTPFNFQAVYGADNRICSWKGVRLDDIVATDPELAILENIYIDWEWSGRRRSSGVWDKWW